MNQEEIKGITFDLPKNRSNVIKVIGVGGGGSNAINYMFQQGIKGVDFIISNTDAQALNESGVPTKIQLGATLTEGLGAGANPEIGAKAAQESQEEIYSILSTQTKMIFITAGMGGGTGTGAAPVIAQMAKSLDILTVGIVTMPFQFEGKLRLEQAQNGLEKIKESVDALIVINNNKLREVYGNLGFKAGFAKADEVLATAARGIAEVITHHYTQNIDLKDAKTVLTNSGTAIMGSGSASGSNRAQEAISKALDSPLLNDNKIVGCKNVLLLIVSGSDEITIDEIGEINDYIQAEAGNQTNIIMGVGEDLSLGNEVSVTVIATGFGKEQQNEISNTEAKKIIHTLEDDQKMEHNLDDKKEVPISVNPFDSLDEVNKEPSLLGFEKPIKKLDEDLVAMSEVVYDLEVEFEVVPNGIFLLKKPLNKESSQMLNEIISDVDTSGVILKNDKMNNEFLINGSDSNCSKDIEDIDLEKNPEEILENNEFLQPQFQGINDLEDQDKIEENFISNSNIDKNILEEEFIINDVFTLISDMEVVDPEFLDQESQIQLDFELPFNEKESNAESKNQFNNDESFNLNQKLKMDLEEPALDIKFELKQDNPISELETNSQKEPEKKLKTDPFEQTINETIETQSEKRIEHLKAFNYKFKHQLQRIEDMENEPAYKRQGLEIENTIPETPSRLSLDSDVNDDLQLRSNNSFLHDNVD
jgi:cell division protein FtsZ